MIHKILSIGALPVLRSEPSSKESLSVDMEVMMPIDLYWDLQELIYKMQYAHEHHLSLDAYWRRFSKKIKPCLLFEKDRQWYLSHIKK